MELYKTSFVQRGLRLTLKKLELLQCQLSETKVLRKFKNVIEELLAKSAKLENDGIRVNMGTGSRVPIWIGKALMFLKICGTIRFT